MSTIAIVAITIFAVIFLLVLIVSAGYLAWDGLRLHRLLTETSTSLPLLIDELGATLKSQQHLLETQIASLDGQKLIDASRANIIACKRIETACLAFSEVVKTLVSEEFIEWKTTVSSLDGGSGGGLAGPAIGSRATPDAFAPPDPTGTPYITRSIVTSGDYIAMARQDEESTTEG